MPGTKVDCDNDGAVHIWVRESSGRLRRAVSPICFIMVPTWVMMLMIQCEKGQSKSPESMLAREAGELIALATHHWQSQNPVVRPRDEV